MERWVRGKHQRLRTWRHQTPDSYLTGWSLRKPKGGGGGKDLLEKAQDGGLKETEEIKTSQFLLSVGASCREMNCYDMQLPPDMELGWGACLGQCDPWAKRFALS